MRVLVVGSRSISNIDLSKYLPQDTDMIITGGARGIDDLAEKYADRNRISKLIIRPKYELYGKYAPIKRNCEMIDIADKILIIWDGVSHGTKHVLEYAKKKKKEFQLIILPPTKL